MPQGTFMLEKGRFWHPRRESHLHPSALIKKTIVVLSTIRKQLS